MNGTKTSSSLAITEKKRKNHQTPGGCIGIFFQFFDWNRRLANKKLFAKKLLPHARAKQVSNKFRGDEKMPNSKLHLIANENNGGFPSGNKGGNFGVDVEQKHEMQVPGLVARLMGLESIPASQRDKDKKASVSHTCSDGEKELLSNCCESNKQGADLDVGIAKHNSRPQKLQKTGTYDRGTVAMFGGEELQIKTVLLRARKYNHHYRHHSKLASPLKTPRNPYNKCSSQSSVLIGAAAKILEPALQATGRAKCLLNSSVSNYPLKNGIVIERMENWSAEVQNQSSYDGGSTKSLMGHASCKNCGNLLDVVDGQPNVTPPIVSDVIAPAKCHKHDVVLLRSYEGKGNAQYCNEPHTRRMPLLGEGPTKWNSSRQPCKVPEDEAPSFAFKQKTHTEERMLRNETISSGSRISGLLVKRETSALSTVSGTKDIVALNRSPSGRTRMRSSTKVDRSKFEHERTPCSKQDHMSSQVSTLQRKRRTPIVSKVENTASLHSVTMMKQRTLCSDAQGGKRRDLDASSQNSSNVKSKGGVQQKTYKKGSKQGSLLGNSCYGNHLSPGSVLEASFSSSSLDETSGHGFHLDSMSCLYGQIEQLDHDAELLDSVVLFAIGKIGYEILTDLVNQIPGVLQRLNLFMTRLTKGKLTHIKNVILNAELVLGDATEHSEDRVPKLLISHFLLDELNTMAGDAMWTDFNGFTGREDSKERSQLKGFLFDCVIECLELNCCKIYSRVFKAHFAWVKLPVCMKAQMLVEEVKREITKWACRAGMVPEELTELEMSHSLEKWTDFDIEAFEAGVDIDGDVLQILVDEIVDDLVDCRQVSV